jgi:hypothetical protein
MTRNEIRQLREKGKVEPPSSEEDDEASFDVAAVASEAVLHNSP